MGIVVDDVPYGASAIALSAPDIDPSDLDHIEVLRGPQGTLYGASSMGGLIKYVTIDPSTAGFSGRVEAGTSAVYNGNKAGENFRAAVNVPVTDALAFRVSGFYREDPGYIDDPVQRVNGVNEGHAYGGHAAALWSPSEAFSLKVSALAQHSELNGSNSVFAGVPGFGDLQQNYVPGSQGYKKDDDVLSATAKAKLGSLDLTAITGYSYFSHYAAEDLSSVFSSYVQPFGVSGAGYNETNSVHKFTQEIRLSASIGTYFDWFVGGFYTHEDYNQDFTFPAIETATGAVAGDFGGGNVSETYQEYAAFADVTAHVTDRFDVQLGLRESHDQQPATRYLYTGDYAQDFYGSNPNRQATAPVSENPFTYLVTPQFRFSSNLMVYARVATGFRPGGGNEIFVSGNDPATYSPDKTINYELGVKGSAWDHVLSFDASVYRINWTGVQFSLTDPKSFNSYTASVGRAKSQGVELSTEVRPLPGMTIGSWVSLGDAALTEQAPAATGLNAPVGSPLPYSSRFSAHFSVDQEIPITLGTSGVVGASVNYVGEREGNFQPTAARAIFPAYAELDVLAGVKHDSWRINSDRRQCDRSTRGYRRWPRRGFASLSSALHSTTDGGAVRFEDILVWPSSSSTDMSLSRVTTNRLRAGAESVAPNEQRDARRMSTTMDHSSIRVLANAFPHSSRGCLALITEINSLRNAHSKRSRIPLIVSAHRVADSVVGSKGERAPVVNLRCTVEAAASVARLGSSNFYVPSDIPDKAGQFSATATQHLFCVILRPALSFLKRYVRRNCAFQAMSRMTLG